MCSSIPYGRKRSAAITDAGRAYEVLKEKIITLELPPGSVVQDYVLTEQLGLGRTPIREALKLLEAENLIVTMPRRGVFVSHVSITDLQQISEIRMELEGLSARLAAQRSTDSNIVAMRACCSEYSQIRPGAVREHILLDRQSHRLFAMATRNRFLASEVERFYDLSLRLWYLALERVQVTDIEVTSHEEIVDAVEARDHETAEALMQEHIRVFQQAIKAAM